jgi:hypothetical protein
LRSRLAVFDHVAGDVDLRHSGRAFLRRIFATLLRKFFPCSLYALPSVHGRRVFSYRSMSPLFQPPFSETHTPFKLSGGPRILPVRCFSCRIPKGGWMVPRPFSSSPLSSLSAGSFCRWWLRSCWITLPPRPRKRSNGLSRRRPSSMGGSPLCTRYFCN